MALEFNEQLSRLQKPDRDEMTDEEYAIFNKNVETMEKNWGLSITSSRCFRSTQRSISDF